jgi:mannose-6-phosphate isomerase-like protein (cupin superfamily)
MLTRTVDESRQDRRGGQTSFLLLGPDGEPASTRLAVTWVEAPPGSEQPSHRHEESEQAYVIVRGRGLMKVADERREVTRGTLVLIPPGSLHSIESVGDEPLVYVSATVPPFAIAPGRWAAGPGAPS